MDNVEGFDDLVFSILENSDERVCGKFVMICWSIWRQCNLKLWQHTIMPLSNVVFEALETFCDLIGTCNHDTHVGISYRHVAV